MSVLICMPAYNEDSGIPSFLEELTRNFGDIQHKFIVINDLSTDNTELTLKRLKQKGFPVDVISNEQNLGHGQSTLTGLKKALQLNPETVIAIDGDGQFFGTEVRRLYEKFKDTESDVIEGVRSTRLDEPWYRSPVSFATRFLVWTKSRKWPKDANTPLRIYKSSVLREILKYVPEDTPVPNLMISAVSRVSDRYIINEGEVTFRPRLGGNPSGTTWRARFNSLPSKRFLLFCLRALITWITFRPKHEK